MDWLELGIALLLGLGLSASTGLNTWLPLLLMSVAAHFGLAGVNLSGSFAWLGSTTAIAVLLVATLIEIVADKVPAVDHALHSVATFIRPLAAAVAMAAAFTELDPMIAGVLGLMIGAPTALGFHSLKAATRVGSSITTFGCANPILSLIDDVVSFFLTIVAIFSPLLVPLFLALVLIAGYKLVQRLRRAPVPSPERLG
jgi:uncharacterized membrane protein